MATYINRKDAGSLIQPEVLTDIWGEKDFEGIIGRLGTRVQVGTKETIIPLANTELYAEFVEKTGTQASPIAGTYPAIDIEDAPDIGYKPVKKLQIEDTRLIVEKLAVIIPVADTVLEDTKTPEAFRDYIIREARKAIERRFEQAAILGINAPATYGAGIVNNALFEGNAVYVDPNDSALTKFSALSEAMGYVEDDYDVSGIALKGSWMSLIRGLTNTPGILLTTDELTGRPTYAVWGFTPIKADILRGSNVEAIVGDWSKVMFGVRNEIQVTASNQATLIDEDGNTLNLFQQNMTAYRVEGRFGYAVLKYANTYPLAVVISAPAIKGTGITATVDGEQVIGSENAITVELNSVTTEVISGLNQKVELVGTPKVYINIGGVEKEYGTVSLVSGGMSIKVTPSGNNGTAAILGDFSFRLPAGSLKSVSHPNNTNKDTFIKLSVVEA